ncbi:hypothetical protein SUGI_0980190 [Cryptomeria japonica]|nr:hypothetical protein SUGI_0980190 [Cryptomeria japonica]
MAKGYVYVYVLLLMLMAASAFAYEESIEYSHNGFCGFWSRAYKGVCDVFTSGCDDTCKAFDNAQFGRCDWTVLKGVACICFIPC